jgi:hypothetical protein
MILRLSLFTALAWLVLGIRAWAQDYSFTNDGLSIKAGSMGDFTLAYPDLQTGEGKSSKIVRKTPAGASTTVEYENGALLSATVAPDGTVNYSFSNLPSGYKRVRSTMLISFAYQQGGKWSMDGSAPKPFPIDKPLNPHLFGNHAGKFELTNYEGKALDITFPNYSWAELVDNREWNWATYALALSLDLNPADPRYQINLSMGSAAAPGEKPTALVDELGQLAAGDWPGKMKSVDELKTDVQDDDAYYKSLATPQLDKYGGLPDSGTKLGLKATGFFHVEKMGEKWALVDPGGNLFFHLGVCCVAPGDDYTLIAGRESAYAWLPPHDGDLGTAYLPDQGGRVVSFYVANIVRKYGKPYSLDELQARMIDRLRKFGFNSIGAFTPISNTDVQAANFPYAGHLPMGPWNSIKDIPGINQTWDPYDPENVAKLEKAFAEGLPKRADDPLLIGYFLVNEPAYEDVPKVVPGLKGSEHACKRALVAMLSDKYKAIDAFNAAWGTSAKTFDELNDAPLAVTTRAASEDVNAFTGQFFDTYFKLVSDTFHKYDQHHMLIGNRLQPGTINNEQLCRISGKYLDVMSFNYYTDAVDKDFLNRIYAWTGRPMFLSEFYWAAGPQSGLAGGRGVATQKDRGLAYRNYVEQSASLGYVVGIEWFTLIDQATTGRWFQGMSGERANTGLFSVVDRPWKDAVKEMKKTNDSIYDVELGKRAPFVFDNPQFAAAGNAQKTANAPRATGPITLDGTTANWPGIPPEVISGHHVVMGNGSGGVEGTFKLCWDDSNLYVLAHVIDPTPLHNSHQNDPPNLWNGDGIELFFGSEKLDQGGPLLFTDRHLMVGAGAAGKAPFYDANSPTQYACQTNLIPGSDGQSYTLEIAVPWTGLGVKPQPGTELLFDLAINDDTGGRGRSRQITWNGIDKNSSDRTHWGRMRLAP